MDEETQLIELGLKAEIDRLRSQIADLTAELDWYKGNY